jgi:Zn/Cd-binding protein ZinT
MKGIEYLLDQSRQSKFESSPTEHLPEHVDFYAPGYNKKLEPLATDRQQACFLRCGEVLNTEFCISVDC